VNTRLRRKFIRHLFEFGRLAQMLEGYFASAEERRSAARDRLESFGRPGQIATLLSRA
jgi:hypothetical protein